MNKVRICLVNLFFVNVAYKTIEVENLKQAREYIFYPCHILSTLILLSFFYGIVYEKGTK